MGMSPPEEKQIEREWSEARDYAEKVLGKAASKEQLDELFELEALAHPVVTHDIYREMKVRGEIWHNLKETSVEIFDRRPGTGDEPAVLLVTGLTWCSPDDQWNRRRGVTIAFGRALKELRRRVEGEQQDKAVVHQWKQEVRNAR